MTRPPRAAYEYLAPDHPNGTGVLAEAVPQVRVYARQHEMQRPRRCSPLLLSVMPLMAGCRWVTLP